MKLSNVVVAAALCVAMAGVVSAQDRHLDWAKSWDSAVAEATARNVPIFVVFSKDN